MMRKPEIVKIPIWKKYLSYLFEFHIESAPSEINPHLYVSLRNGRFQLSTANAVYSFADLYDNFSLTFDKIDLPENGKEVLLLGFGLGSIPFMLEKKYNRQYYYTAVEIDENVLYLANKYTLPELEASISMIPSDAYAYVHYCEMQFDMICMDVFLDDVVPDNFETADFLKQLQGLLKPTGMLLFNKLAANEKDIKQAEQFFKTFKSVFPEAIYLEVNGNWMLINTAKLVQ